MGPSRDSSHAGLSSPPVRSPPLPATNGHDMDNDTVIRTNILLLGLRRVGKTSIQEVLFNGVVPKQTFYLETTSRIMRLLYDTVIPLEIWDCPSNVTQGTLGVALKQFSTIIFVIDIQELFQPAIAKLVDFFISAYQESPAAHLEVFVHKADTLSEEYKIETFRHIQERVLDELLDISAEYEQMPINFHLTSIYDHSLHEAFSKVLHKLIDSLPYMEDLLNVFYANTQASKVFLFDITSRLYVATDASPVDPPTFSLCSDYLQMLNSFGHLYRSISASPLRYRQPSQSIPTPPAAVSPTPLSNSHTPTLSASPRSSASNVPSAHSIPHLSLSTAGSDTPSERPKAKSLFYPSSSASLSPNSAGAGKTISYHLITPELALVALVPTPVFDAKRGLFEYNVVVFREGVQEICEVEEDARRRTLQ